MSVDDFLGGGFMDEDEVCFVYFYIGIERYNIQ